MWLRNFLRKINRDDILQLAAALSFYITLSLIPMIVLLIAFLSFMAPVSQTKLFEEVAYFFGEQPREAVQFVAKYSNTNFQIGTWWGFYGLCALLFSVGGTFGQLRFSLNQIFQVSAAERKPSGVRSKTGVLTQLLIGTFFNMALALGFVLIALSSLLVASLIAKQWLRFGYFILSLLIFGFSFTVMYLILPRRKISVRRALLSGFSTAVLFSLGNSFIGYYLSLSKLNNSYGIAGTLVGVLLWIYYSSIVVYAVAEVSSQMDNK